MGSLVKEYRVFPTGATFKPTETINNVADGTVVSIQDNGPYYETPPANTEYDYCIYSRLFWNAAGAISTSQSVSVTVKGTTVVTGWYSHGCSPGGDGTSITTYAFDVDANVELSGTSPIGSVVPSSLWTTGSSSVTPASSGSVTIDAKDSIGARDFVKWLVFGAGSLSSDDVIIPAKQGGFYVAFYKKPKSPGIDVGILKHLFDLAEVGILDVSPVDPGPEDLFRLALVAAQLQAKLAGAPVVAGASVVAGGTADARQSLARVKSEIKRLQAEEQALSKKISGSTKGQ